MYTDTNERQEKNTGEDEKATDFSHGSDDSIDFVSLQIQILRGFPTTSQNRFRLLSLRNVAKFSRIIGQFLFEFRAKKIDAITFSQ